MQQRSESCPVYNDYLICLGLLDAELRRCGKDREKEDALKATRRRFQMAIFGADKPYSALEIRL